MGLERFAVALLVALMLVPLVHWVGQASASSSRPIIHSVWATTPPSINGQFEAGEWGNPQIVFTVPPYDNSYLNASVYFANDASKLYVMVDAVGDQTDDRGDESLLVFNYPHWVWVEFWGVGGTICRGGAGGCFAPSGTIGAVGYYTSPNSAQRHKIYEVSIPLASLNATAGQTLDFCSPKKPLGTSVPPTGGSSISFDESTRRDNPWPDGLVFYVDPATNTAHTDVNTWGRLSLAPNPVPEFPNQTVPAASALVLVCLILISYAHRKRTIENNHP
jgi:hypothetical protein